MRWIIVCVLLTTTVPVWAAKNKNNAVQPQPAESNIWNQKMCPQGIEDIKVLITLNPYDSNGKCFNYVGRLVQLLNKNKALFSLMTDPNPFALIDFGKDSVTIGPFMGVVKGKGAYSYQTVSGIQNNIFNFVPVPKSAERDLWDKNRAKEKAKEKEIQLSEKRAKVEKEWKKKIEDSKDTELIADPFIYTDKSTGLQWSRNGNISEIKMRWKDAMQWVKTLSYGGHSDWRLPTKEEFKVFMDSAEDRSLLPRWLNNNGFFNVQSASYWTSSIYSPGNYWYAQLYQANVRTINDSDYYVWPVRDGKETVKKNEGP